MRSIKRITKIHKIEGYHIFCQFNNGESRIIDFAKLFEMWDIQKYDIEFKISKSKSEFAKVKLVEGTLSWSNVMSTIVDEKGKTIAVPYELDPIVLYENSEVDPSREIELGMLIKQTRSELGLTQKELADKSGTTKHYISRLENNKTGIELSTLKRIIEGGFGKRMEINIS